MHVQHEYERVGALGNLAALHVTTLAFSADVRATGIEPDSRLAQLVMTAEAYASALSLAKLMA